MGTEPILHASILHQPENWYEHTSYPDKSAKLYPVTLNLVEVIPSFMKNQSQRKGAIGSPFGIEILCNSRASSNAIINMNT